ncbi:MULTISPECIES: hypothetical protein [Streptomyces]|uniref:hypothetical protein n=1 Tax=Streptomyces TaxID=1883 RepID=UPI000A731A18|nr:MULTISPECIES: hypothetical protein [Streptomyces]
MTDRTPHQDHDPHQAQQPPHPYGGDAHGRPLPPYQSEPQPAWTPPASGAPQGQQYAPQDESQPHHQPHHQSQYEPQYGSSYDAMYEVTYEVTRVTDSAGPPGSPQPYAPEQYGQPAPGPSHGPGPLPGPAPQPQPQPQHMAQPQPQQTAQPQPPHQPQPYAHPGAAGPLPPEHHPRSQPMPQPQPHPAPHPPAGSQPQPQPYAQPHAHPHQQPPPQPHATPYAPQPHPQAQGHPQAQAQPQAPQAQPHPQSQPHPQAAPGGVATAAAPAAPAGAAAPAAGTPGTAAPAAATSRGARPRTGSPIIPPGFPSAGVTTVLAALLAATAPLGQGALTAAVVLLQALTAAGWYRLNGMWPARQGIALAFVAGLSADAGLLLTDGPGSTPTVLIGAAGVWCVLSLVLQLRNNSSPDERLYAVTAGFAATGLTVLAAGVIPAEPEAVTLGAAAVAGAALLRAVPLPAVLSLLIALAAAAGAAVGAAQLNGVENLDAALLGAGVGVCALVGLRVASYDWPSRFVHMTAGVALPLTLATPALHILGNVLL